MARRRKKDEIDITDGRKEEIDHLNKEATIKALLFIIDQKKCVEEAKDNDQDKKNLQAELNEINSEYKEAIIKKQKEIDYIVKHLEKISGV